MVNNDSNSVINRAKVIIVKMSGVLVFGFIICWAPYYIMSFWWWLDMPEAQKIDVRIRKMMWAFASANNCLNPIFYNMFEKSKADTQSPSRVTRLYSRTPESVARNVSLMTTEF